MGIAFEMAVGSLGFTPDHDDQIMGEIAVLLPPARGIAV
jgi:hypothetical protein